jgi:co-chaperonin GroES (HSP10)
VSSTKINPAGIFPVEFKCLIKQEAVEDSDPELARAKRSGIVLPEEFKSREQMGGVRATLLAVGGNAFEDWKGEKPKPGDRVYTARYSGIEVVGNDGGKYRLVNDKDCLAVIGGAP